MKSNFYSKLSFTILLIGTLFLSCSKEELPQDKLIGEWTIYSIAETEGETIIWKELEDKLVDLIPEYSCLDFTASATENLITTSYVFIDVNGRGCLSPVISVYTWQVDPESGIYSFIQGSNAIKYRITFSNSDNRMVWNDQASGAITIWDRVVTSNEDASE